MTKNETESNNAAVLKALKGLKAFHAEASRSAEDIAKKAKSVTEARVKHYCYKDGALVKSGLVAIARFEGDRNLYYYLTAKGKKEV